MILKAENCEISFDAEGKYLLSIVIKEQGKPPYKIDLRTHKNYSNVRSQGYING